MIYLHVHVHVVYAIMYVRKFPCVVCSVYVLHVRGITQLASSGSASAFAASQPTTKLFIDGQMVESKTDKWINNYNPVRLHCCVPMVTDIAFLFMCQHSKQTPQNVCLIDY